MNDFIESLKRLYEHDAISSDQIKELLNNKKISTPEYEYITKDK